MTSLTTVVILVITIIFPGQRPMQRQERMGSIDECWDIARELTASAEATIMPKRGGVYDAACNIEVQPSEEH